MTNLCFSVDPGMVYVQSSCLYTGRLRGSFCLQPSRGVSGQVRTSRRSFIVARSGGRRTQARGRVVLARGLCASAVYRFALARFFATPVLIRMPFTTIFC